MHICEYVIKATKPKKLLMVLSGDCDDFNFLFKNSSVLTLDAPHAGDVLAHALNAPLFLEPATLWVDLPFEPGPLRKLLLEDMQQPVIYNTPCDIKLAELAHEWKQRVQVVDKSRLKPGSKLHKDFLMFLLERELNIKNKILLTFVEQLSSFLDPEDFFRSYDRLVQVIYGISEQNTLDSEILKKWIAKTSPKQWRNLLNPPKTPLVSEVVDTFFIKSKSVYTALDVFFQQGGHPLALIKALQTQAKHYLNSAWAIRNSKGSNMEAHTVAQGQKVMFSDFKKYQTSVLKFFGEPALWELLKDICLVQAKYQSGATSQLPLYSLVIHYVGPGF